MPGEPSIDIRARARGRADAPRTDTTSPGGEAEDLAEKVVFTTGEAARICNVSQQTIIRCFDRGRLTGFRVPGSRFRRIPRAELVRFMQDNNIPLERLEGARKRVVVVAADQAHARAMADAIARGGHFECFPVDSTFSAGLLIGAVRPQGIIILSGLPGVDAAGMIRLIRERAETESARIVCIQGPGNGNPPAGVDLVLHAPAHAETAAAKLSELLGVDSPRARRGRG